jgi:CheY-like chemotaxis protein
MSKKVIVVIDDDKIFHFMIKKILQRIDENIKVLSFYDGNTALKFLESVSFSGNLFPDFIFLDINMPLMNGWEFLEVYQNELCEVSKIVPLYIVSSSNDSQDKEKAQQKNVTGYLVKPLKTVKLESIIKNR